MAAAKKKEKISMHILLHINNDMPISTILQCQADTLNTHGIKYHYKTIAVGSESNSFNKLESASCNIKQSFSCLSCCESIKNLRKGHTK